MLYLKPLFLMFYIFGSIGLPSKAQYDIFLDSNILTPNVFFVIFICNYP